MSPENVIAQAFGVDPSQIGDATSSENVDGWDSLGQITLIIELESAYGVSFSPEEAMTMTSVAAIKRVLGAHGAAW